MDELEGKAARSPEPKPSTLEARRGKEDANTTTSSISTMTTRTTRYMNADAPRKAVFNTTELLEHILSYLPPSNLFGCQRVSRQFQDLITSSVHLKRRMGVKAWVGDKDKHFWKIAVGWNNDTKKEDLMFTRLAQGEASYGNPNVVIPVEVNYPLKRAPTTRESELNSAYRSHTIRGSDCAIFDTVQMQITGTHSWHAILLTDWPTPKATFDLYWCIRDGVSGYVCREVFLDGDDQGVTLGMLMTEALDTLDKKTASYGWWDDKDSCGIHDKVTLRELLEGLEKKYRRKAVITSGTIIRMQGVVVPNEVEWQRVD